MPHITTQLFYEDVEAFFEIGVAYLKMNDKEKARRYFNLAMDRDYEMASLPLQHRLWSVRLVQDHEFFIVAKVALAYVEAGDFEEAFRVCREKQADKYDEGSRAATAVVLAKIALRHKALNDIPRARQVIEEALRAAETVPNEPERKRLREDILVIRDTRIGQK